MSGDYWNEMIQIPRWIYVALCFFSACTVLPILVRTAIEVIKPDDGKKS
jgi:hypothetical protein